MVQADPITGFERWHGSGVLYKRCSRMMVFVINDIGPRFGQSLPQLFAGIR
jgi:hypothetical protein